MCSYKSNSAMFSSCVFAMKNSPRTIYTAYVNELSDVPGFGGCCCIKCKSQMNVAEGTVILNFSINGSISCFLL